MCVCVCVCARARACVRACVHACMHVCVFGGVGGGGGGAVNTVSKFFLNFISDTVSAAVVGLFYLIGSVIKLVVPQVDGYL